MLMNEIELGRWSGREDLNFRPPSPELGAITRLLRLGNDSVNYYLIDYLNIY